MKTLILCIGLTLCAISANYSQDIYDPNRMVSTLDAECKSNGYTLSILRYLHKPTSTAFKIQLRFHTTKQEYGGQVRKNILSNAYSSSGLFSYSMETRNSQVGDYCDRDNGWITGLVYSITYPNQNSNAGSIYTTNLGFDSGIESNTQTISDMISTYNSMRGSNPYLSSCSVSVCGSDPNSNPDKDKDDLYDKKDGEVDAALIKEHKDFLGNNNTVNPGSSGAPIIRDASIDKSKAIKNDVVRGVDITFRGKRRGVRYGNFKTCKSWYNACESGIPSASAPSGFNCKDAYKCKVVQGTVVIDFDKNATNKEAVDDVKNNVKQR